MKLFHILAIAAALSGYAMAAEPAPVPAVTAPEPSATVTPVEVVKTLYDGYFAALNGTRGQSDPLDVNWMDYADKFFTPELEARIKKSQQVEGGLGVDFLIAGQDYQDLKVNSVEATASADTTATVRVNVSNMGTVTNTDVTLTKLATGWRIADIAINAGTDDQFSLTDGLKDLGL